MNVFKPNKGLQNHLQVKLQELYICFQNVHCHLTGTRIWKLRVSRGISASSYLRHSAETHSEQDTVVVQWTAERFIYASRKLYSKIQVRWRESLSAECVNTDRQSRSTMHPRTLLGINGKPLLLMDHGVYWPNIWYKVSPCYTTGKRNKYAVLCWMIQSLLKPWSPNICEVCCT